MADQIVNRVAQSGIVTLDLETLRIAGERVLFDIGPNLHGGLVLREKEFREFVKSNNWSRYSGKIVGITCTVDAIVPKWAYMMVSIALQPFASRVFFGGLKEIEERLFHETLLGFDAAAYKDARVVIKGCSDGEVPVEAYVRIAALLKPYAKSIMYGEACSSVPLFRKDR
jgi:hypothetical protein